MIIRCGSTTPQDEPPASRLATQCLTRPKNDDPAVVPPKLIRRVEPKVARTDPSPVSVCLEGVVATDGSLTRLAVVKSGGAAMDVAALDAVRQWRYAPATRDGAPIEFPIQIGVSMTSR